MPKILTVMNHIRDIQENPLKSVFLLSIPIIAILFLQTLYSVIDSFWIAGLGQSAIIAVGYVLSLWYILQKLGEGIGRSCNVLISTSFGANDYEKANNIACHGLIIILILAVLIPVMFILLIKPICILGHLEQYSDLISDYFLIPSIFIVFVLLTNYFAAILGSEGDTKRASLIVIFANLINIILDPILIYEFNFGIFGAGLATTASCMISFALFYYLYYVRGDVVVRADKNHFSYDIKIFKQIIKLAVPLIINGFIISIFGLLINYSLHIFSNPLISFGYVVLLRIQTLLFTPIQGVSQGVCIVTAHLTGAKRFNTLAYTLKKSLIIIMIFSAAFAVIYLFSYHHIVYYFTDNADARNAIGSIIVFSILNFLLQPAIRISNYAFIGLGKSIYTLFSLFLNVSLFVVFMLIATLIFNSQEFGIFISVILADVVQLAIMLLLVQRSIGRCIEKENKSLTVC
ncbi:putative efflux protein, MATE family [Methanobrevibacter millerae]|uniref:Multidrug-efflux transporter n=2 Tax=Methanobrevibacter millerae TaxID=230361 RepID=A0A1G5VJH9_9EURY|nr:putative efflux protein, MATE family [Methanobrevibacter millerae]